MMKPRCSMMMLNYFSITLNWLDLANLFSKGEQLSNSLRNLNEFQNEIRLLIQNCSSYMSKDLVLPEIKEH